MFDLPDSSHFYLRYFIVDIGAEAQAGVRPAGEDPPSNGAQQPLDRTAHPVALEQAQYTLLHDPHCAHLRPDRPSCCLHHRLTLLRGEPEHSLTHLHPDTGAALL